MKDHAAEGRYHEYQGKARDAANALDVLLGGIAWHAEHARTHPDTPADFARLATLFDEAQKLDARVTAYLDEANRAAAMAGYPCLTRTHLRQTHP